MHRLLLLLAVLFTAVPSRADGPPATRSRVWRKTSGFVRVPAEALRRLGLPHAPLAVTHRGAPVPVLPPGPDGDLLFLALDPGGPHSVWGAYDIHPRAPAEADLAAAPRIAAGPPAPIVLRRTLDADRLFGPLAAAEPAVYQGDRPTSFLARIPPGSGVSLPLDPSDAAPGQDQVLEALVYAARAGTVAVEAVWGAAELGRSTTPDAVHGHVFTWRVPAGSVVPEGALLVLKDVSPEMPPAEAFDATDDRGTLFVDAISVVGPVRPLVGRALRRYPMGADGAPPLEAQDATQSIPHRAVVGDVLCVSTEAEEVQPVPVGESPDPLAVAKDAVHVIVAVPPLMEGARRLARHRTEHGIASVAIPVAAVYEAFSFGERDPDALMRFFEALAKREGTPVRFVLLAGDATLDRTDVIADETIPAPMARTKYNGATASDRLYVQPEDRQTGGPSIGRLPFRTAAEMDAYVERLIRYETAPPVTESRRLLRFVTGEGRFNPVIDGVIKKYFRNLLSEHVPPSYAVEMTYASPSSPFFWPPPEFSDKVVSDLNDGSLFYTYVGHGYAEGFDWVAGGDRRWPIFTLKDVAKVDIQGLPPGVLVFACTTAMFDRMQGDGVGEALLKRPRGPVAYYGATRICHPAANAMLGRALTSQLLAGAGRRSLGEILDAARDEMLDPSGERPKEEMLLRAFLPKEDRDLTRLYGEAAHLYALLGDPALVPAFPAEDLVASGRLSEDGASILVEVTGPLPDGATVLLSLEAPRSRVPVDLAPVADPADPAAAPAIRANHARANDRTVWKGSARFEKGKAAATVPVPDALRGGKALLVASHLSASSVHQGATELDVPASAGR